MQKEVVFWESGLCIGDTAVVTAALKHIQARSFTVKKLASCCLDVLVQLVNEGVQLLSVLRLQFQSITGMDPLAQGAGPNSLAIGPNKSKERPESIWCEPLAECLLIKGLCEEPPQKFQLALEFVPRSLWTISSSSLAVLLQNWEKSLIQRSLSLACFTVATIRAINMMLAVSGGSEHSSMPPAAY